MNDKNIRLIAVLSADDEDYSFLYDNLFYDFTEKVIMGDNTFTLRQHREYEENPDSSEKVDVFINNNSFSWTDILRLGTFLLEWCEVNSKKYSFNYEIFVEGC